MNKGKKDDKDKLRYDLIPWCIDEELAKVVTHGAEKYGENNWAELRECKCSLLCRTQKAYTGV